MKGSVFAALVVAAALSLGVPIVSRADCHCDHHRPRRSYSFRFHYDAEPYIGYYSGLGSGYSYYSPYTRFRYRRYWLHRHGIYPHGGSISVYGPRFGLSIGFGGPVYGYYHHDIYFPHGWIGHHHHW